MVTTKTMSHKFASGGQERVPRPSCVNLWRCVCRNVARTRIILLVAAVFCGVVMSLSVVVVRDEFQGPDFEVLFQPMPNVQFPTDSRRNAVVRPDSIQNLRNLSKMDTSPRHANGTRRNSSETRHTPTPKKVSPSAPINITELISEFSKLYAHNFSEDSEVFFAQMKQIYGKQWKPNAERTKTFRRDIRSALGKSGQSANVYLTKHNTPRRWPMIYYMKGKRRNISDSVWNTLPKTSVLGSDKFDTCSVVGSSGMLYKSNCGKRIDNADFVARFNLAPVKGFEADVGSKTNFTSLNPTFIMRKMNSLRHPDNYTLLNETLKQFRDSLLYLPGFAVSGSLRLLVKTATVVRELHVAQPIYGSPYHFLAVATVWRKALDMGLKWPSTGLYAVSSLFDACHRINVYGFWPFLKSMDGNDVPYHYHNNVRGTTVHKFDKEFKMLLHLHNLGIIRLQLTPC